MMNYDQFPSMSYHQQKGIIKVTGTGTVKADPDMAIINLGVITEDMSLEKAQKDNAAISAAVIGSLFQLSIPKKDIRTSVYDVQPQYDYVEGKQVFRGYKVTNILSVTIRNTASVGKVIDTATANGANRIENIRFTVENPSEYYKHALELAVKDAVEKAKEIGYNLGVQINPIPFKVSEETFSVVVQESPTMKLAASVTPILPGQVDITARLEVIFEY